MYVVQLFILFAVFIAVTAISTYALVDWWRRNKASEPYPVREVPQMLAMMEMEDGSFVLTLREGPTTHIDDAFDGVKFSYTGGYLKEIRARSLFDLGIYLRERGGYFEAPVLLNEIEQPGGVPLARARMGNRGHRRDPPLRAH